MSRFILIAILAASSATAQTKQRTFEFTYIAELDIPEGSDRIQMWLPYPKRDDYQDVRLLGIKAPVPTKLYQEYTYRNSMLFLSARAADFVEMETLQVEMSFRVTRNEHQESETEYTELEDPEGWVESSASRWLRSDALADDVADVVREHAEELTEGRDSVVDKAKAIFDYTVDNVDYGEGRDQCVEFHTVFSGNARAVGIAVKFQIGFSIPAEPGEGEIAGPHCWGEFYVPGFGWVPVDTAEAKLKPDQREYFFGAHDAHRVELTLGRGIVLNPKQSGQPIDYFIYPYAEIDGKPFDDIRRQFFYKDLDLVAE